MRTEECLFFCLACLVTYSSCNASVFIATDTKNSSFNCSINNNTSAFQDGPLQLRNCSCSNVTMQSQENSTETCLEKSGCLQTIFCSSNYEHLQYTFCQNNDSFEVLHVMNCTIDYDECANPNECHPNSMCIDGDREYSCECHAGFTGNGTHCSNVNECDYNPCDGNATCTDTDGSYTCSCNAGFTGNGTNTCEDLNECGNYPCHTNASCFNTIGSFTCTCNEGFTGNGSHCSNVNECDKIPCDGNATCTDTDGSYTCSCNAGFTGNGTNTCEDLNECASDPCHTNASCLNAIGNFTCTCNEGFTGNGSHCSKVEPPCTTEDRATEGSGGKMSCSAYLSQRIQGANTTEAVETATQTLVTVTSTSEELSAEAVVTVASFFDETATLAKTGQIQVTKDSARNFLVAANNLQSGYFQQTPGDDMTPEDLEESKAIKKQLSQSLPAVVLRIELGPSGQFNDSNEFVATQVTRHDEDDESDIVASSTNVKVTIPNQSAEKGFRGGSTSDRTKREGSSDSRRSAFLFYSDDSLFYSSENVSSVVSVDVGLNGSVDDLPVPIRIQHVTELSRHGKSKIADGNLQALKTSIVCAFWDYDLGEWRTEGCCLNFSSETPECLCDHLTNFALIVKSENVPADVVLSLVSDIGCALSIAGLILTLLVHAISPELRKRRPAKILMQICINLCISYVLFVAGITHAMETQGCHVVAFFLHYFLLTAWCWMSVYTYDMYLSLVQVFRTKQSFYLRKLAGLAYGVPVLVAVLTVAIAVGVDNNQPTLLCGQVPDPLATSAYLSDNVCWLRGFSLYIGFLLPVGVLLLYNIVVFVIVFRELATKTKVQSSASKHTHKQRLIVAVTMAMFMGLTWIFGFLILFSEDPTYITVVSWLFALFNTLQGFAIFLLTVIRRPEMRKVWWNPVKSRVSRASSEIAVKMSNSRNAYSVTQTTNANSSTMTDMTSVNDSSSVTPPLKKEYFVEVDISSKEDENPGKKDDLRQITESDKNTNTADEAGDIAKKETTENGKVQENTQGAAKPKVDERSFLYQRLKSADPKTEKC